MGEEEGEGSKFEKGSGQSQITYMTLKMSEVWKRKVMRLFQTIAKCGWCLGRLEIPISCVNDLEPKLSEF